MRVLAYVRQRKLLRRAIVFVSHAGLVTVAFLLAFQLRFDFAISEKYWAQLRQGLPVLLAARLSIFAWYGLYRGLWRYIGIPDALAILRAVSLSSLLFVAAVPALFGAGFPRSVFVLDWLLCLALVIGSRLLIRVGREARQGRTSQAGRRAIVIGVGDAADTLLREIERNSALNYHVLGIVDTAADKRGQRIREVAVLGGLRKLGELCDQFRIEELLIAAPSASPSMRGRIIEACRATKLPFKTVPVINDLILGRAAISQLQEINPDDLLGRDTVDIDLEEARVQISDGTVLVTGAAGSIGSELCRQLLRLSPRRIVLLDQAESDLYFLHMELNSDGHDVEIIPVVGDIVNDLKMQELFDRHRPAVVYHAAAYKHVPLMEADPLEAIRNNAIGTEVVAGAARRCGSGRFVLISTDKAVHPVGVMGKTKRLAECVLQSLGSGNTVFTSVRFGNVLGSAGSVLPLFKWQAARGEAITLTEPEATRYFMLISEAARLVLQAGAIARGGEVFFLDMGQPVRIGDLAENLLRFSGLEPGRDVPIDVIGLRPGERLDEVLVRENAVPIATGHDRILRVVHDDFGLHGFTEVFEDLKRAVHSRDSDRATRLLDSIVLSN